MVRSPSNPTVLKRGPKPGSPSMLRRRLDAALAKKKRKYVLPNSRMWPGQVAAGVAALRRLVHPDAYATNRHILYTQEFEAVVRAVFKAAVKARVERAKVLKRRAEKRSAKSASPQA